MSMRIALIVAALLSPIPARAAPPAGLSEADFTAIQRALAELQASLKPFRDKPDRFADADIFAKGVTWALRYETKLEPADVALIKKSLERGKQRATVLAAGKRPWADKTGQLVRGYVSIVDGSTQPFGLVIPAKYDPTKRTRLDVVLHGSSRPVGLSELRFMNRFDDGDEGGKPAPDVDYIELHPLGRVENCYRWAGETDVFEAIAAVSREYKIDDDRIVLRGMSMGASGTWHLGLKHPDKFVALGPYCGYVDTYNFSQTPLKNFVKVDKLPPYQEKTLHMLDSIDYAANAGMVPVVAAMGEKDVFFNAHVLMGKAMEKEGLKLVNLISPGTGHVIDPVTHKEQMRRIGEYAATGINRKPKHVRFVTWTLKYPTCHWLDLGGLEEHYARAEIEAEQNDEGLVDVKLAKNVTNFAILRFFLPKKLTKVRVDGQEVKLEGKPNITPLHMKRDGKQWKQATVKDDSPRRWLPGPIDDAFTTPFLCVRGTGKPWNPAVQAWSEANLKRFEYEWARYFRGDLPVKDDKDVTNEDVQNKHLILFGDPGSNAWIAKALPKLPIDWTREAVSVGKLTYTADRHAPVFICPNPLAGQREDRYVVINSGHTFHEKELASLNYLLFPRLGEWAILKVGDKEPLQDEVLKVGFFDEQWKVK